MKDRVDARKVSPRLTHSTMIMCSKCISEGKIEAYKPPVEMKVVNISRDGLCISTSEVFKEGTVLEFDIKLEDTLYKFISAKIIWNIKNEDSYRYGLNIKNISGKFNSHICKLESRISTSI